LPDQKSQDLATSTYRTIVTLIAYITWPQVWFQNFWPSQGNYAYSVKWLRRFGGTLL